MSLPPPVPETYRDPVIARAIALIAQSHARLLGEPLVEAAGGSGDDDDVVRALWLAPRAIVAHGVEDDPLFFFGNARALAAFETDVARFAAMPSRLSAEAPLRGERQALLDRVTRDGFIRDYAGVRISATGRRFHIAGATVWNLIDEHGRRHGQAATFAP